MSQAVFGGRPAGYEDVNDEWSRPLLLPTAYAVGMRFGLTARVGLIR